MLHNNLKGEGSRINFHSVRVSRMALIADRERFEHRPLVPCFPGMPGNYTPGQGV